MAAFYLLQQQIQQMASEVGSHPASNSADFISAMKEKYTSAGNRSMKGYETHRNPEERSHRHSPQPLKKVFTDSTSKYDTLRLEKHKIDENEGLNDRAHSDRKWMAQRTLNKPSPIRQKLNYNILDLGVPQKENPKRDHQKNSQKDYQKNYQKDYRKDCQKDYPSDLGYEARQSSTLRHRVRMEQNFLKESQATSPIKKFVDFGVSRSVLGIQSQQYNMTRQQLEDRFKERARQNRQRANKNEGALGQIDNLMSSIRQTLKEAQQVGK